MATEEAARVWDEAQKFYDFVIAEALNADVCLPERQYITIGEAAYDCEQFVVTIRLLQTGMPSALPTIIGEYYNCTPAWSVVLEAAIVRCAPTQDESGAPPSPEALQASAKEMALDAYILMQAAGARASEAFGAVLANVAGPAPSGGLSAAVGTFTVAVF